LATGACLPSHRQAGINSKSSPSDKVAGSNLPTIANFIFCKDLKDRSFISSCASHADRNGKIHTPKLWGRLLKGKSLWKDSGQVRKNTDDLELLYSLEGKIGAKVSKNINLISNFLLQVQVLHLSISCQTSNQHLLAIL